MISKMAFIGLNDISLYFAKKIYFFGGINLFCFSTDEYEKNRALNAGIFDKVLDLNSNISFLKDIDIYNISSWNNEVKNFFELNFDKFKKNAIISDFLIFKNEIKKDLDLILPLDIHYLPIFIPKFDIDFLDLTFSETSSIFVIIPDNNLKIYHKYINLCNQFNFKVHVINWAKYYEYIKKNIILPSFLLISIGEFLRNELPNALENQEVIPEFIRNFFLIFKNIFLIGPIPTEILLEIESYIKNFYERLNNYFSFVINKNSYFWNEEKKRLLNIVNNLHDFSQFNQHKIIIRIKKEDDLYKILYAIIEQFSKINLKLDSYQFLDFGTDFKYIQFKFPTEEEFKNAINFLKNENYSILYN